MAKKKINEETKAEERVLTPVINVIDRDFAREDLNLLRDKVNEVVRSINLSAYESINK